MGLLDNLEWMNAYGKKRCISLFWRMRAEVNRAFKKESKQRLKFQYDPSSYALNFDDGCFCSHLRDTMAKKFIVEDARAHELKAIENTNWVYVIWIKTS